MTFSDLDRKTQAVEIGFCVALSSVFGGFGAILFGPIGAGIFASVFLGAWLATGGFGGF